MKVPNVSAMVLLLMIAGILFFGCASQADSTPVTENQIVTVERGDIKIDIMASGNLVILREANLSFGSSGTVEEVLVGIGDSVEENEVLAKIDTLALEDSLIQAQANVKTAQLNLERAKEPATNASGTEILTAPDPLDIDIKELKLESAKLGLKEAEIKLEEATITAPFDGQVAEVNVSIGDQVSDSTVAVRLIDPTKFEVDVLVSETEIYQVEVGAQATVQVDAMSMIAFPAKVAHISPAATIQSNVVNYEVQVEIDSLETVLGGQEQTRPNISAGEMPERIKQAIEAGQITQEQVEEMMRQRQQGSQQGQTPATMPEDFHLKEGLTVTVSILVDERTNVLLVPNSIIVSQGRNVVVQVMKDGVIESRSIKTGISDWQYTEVTEGLSEGEQVVTAQTATTTSTTSQQGGPPGGIVPGMGRMLR